MMPRTGCVKNKSTSAGWAGGETRYGGHRVVVPSPSQVEAVLFFTSPVRRRVGNSRSGRAAGEKSPRQVSSEANSTVETKMSL